MFTDIVRGLPHSGILYCVDGLDQPVTGEAASFVATATLDGVPDALVVTITEVDDGTRPGEYRYQLTAPLLGRILYLHVTHPTIDVLGWESHLRLVDKLAEDISIQNLGVGNRVVVVTVEDGGTSAPIPGTFVEVYDATSTTKVAFGYTNASGQITFELFDGAYKVYLSKIGQYVFTVPEDLTVVAGLAPPPDVEVTYEGTLFNPSSPPSPSVCIVYGWERAPDGGGLAVEVEAEIMASTYFLSANPHVIRKVATVSAVTHVNGPGYWELALTRSSEFAGDEEVTYRFSIDEQPQGDYVAPDVGSIPFRQLIGL